tara:strand:- start:14212 stop:15894 length:1683 start_codon:yes stop_codon:yes gene_type:complete
MANNLTYHYCQSHYRRYGKYCEHVNWIPAPFRWNTYTCFDEIVKEIGSCDILLMSSYTWNADLVDKFAQFYRKLFPDSILVIGGPHIGTNEAELLKKREELFDYICLPTKPGEVFVQDLIDEWFENNGSPLREKIAWELKSEKKRSLPFDLDYSIYKEHSDTYKLQLDHAKKYRLEPFISLETTRGCPYKCVYCEWGGGTGTKVYQKPLDIVKEDIRVLTEMGYTNAYLTDANFGIFKERDFEIYRFAHEKSFALTDISTVKVPQLARRKELIDFCFDVVGKGPEVHTKVDTGTDMWGMMEYASSIPAVSIQSISTKAMTISHRIDLKTHEKIELSKHIYERCNKEGFPVPAIELILAMPGSTLKDFYEEMNLIWNFQAWNSFRHDYMFLPDSELNSQEYKDKYNIETVEVYSDIVDEDGIDNWNSLYRNKRSYFKTIRSCFSFSAEEMVEMWFMNNAANFLLRNIYPMVKEHCTPPLFAKSCYTIIQTLEGFNYMQEEIYDLYNPKTEPRSIRKLQGSFRVEVIEKFLARNQKLIYNEIFKQFVVKKDHSNAESDVLHP